MPIFPLPINIQELAIKFAPIVYHADNEPNLPTNVDWFLARTTLCFMDHVRTPGTTVRIIDHPKQVDLLNRRQQLSDGMSCKSDGTRSQAKQVSFFLADVPDGAKAGSADTRDWTTYFHAYRMANGGTNIQYWRFYAFNTGIKKTLRIGQFQRTIEVGSHGGDWEGVQVLLDDHDRPISLRLLGHQNIDEYLWSQIEIDRGHPVIFSEFGGHSSKIRGLKNGLKQETWGNNNGAQVLSPNGSSTPGGQLVDVGSKLSPASGQVFIKYSGLWGSPSSVPGNNELYRISSGYWGPAFNETERNTLTGFCTAWGYNSADPDLELSGSREFFPDSESP